MSIRVLCVRLNIVECHLLMNPMVCRVFSMKLPNFDQSGGERNGLLYERVIFIKVATSLIWMQ